MSDLNQLILNFDYDQNFKDQDFYVSKSNEFVFKLLNSWPKWEKNFVNLIGEKFSGKTHLINIFLLNDIYLIHRQHKIFYCICHTTFLLL